MNFRQLLSRFAVLLFFPHTQNCAEERLNSTASFNFYWSLREVFIKSGKRYARCDLDYGKNIWKSFLYFMTLIYFFNYLGQDHFTTNYYYYYYYYYFTPWEFFTSALVNGFPLEVVWQQVTSSFQDSSQYSGWSRQWCSLDCLHTLFPRLQSLCQSFDNRIKNINYNWYNCQFHGRG